MRFVIAADRPFGEMTDQRILRDLELGDVDARALLFLSVDLGRARVGNKIRFPDPLPIVRRQVALVARRKIIRLAVVAIAEAKVAIEDKFLVVIVVQRHGCCGDRQKQRRLVGVIDQPVQSVHRRRE